MLSFDIIYEITIFLPISSILTTRLYLYQTVKMNIYPKKIKYLLWLREENVLHLKYIIKIYLTHKNHFSRSFAVNKWHGMYRCRESSDCRFSNRCLATKFKAFKQILFLFSMVIIHQNSQKRNYFLTHLP